MLFRRFWIRTMKPYTTFQDENYDILGQEEQEQEGEGNGENEESQVNGVNDVDNDQPIMNGETLANTTVTGERQPNKIRVTTPYLTKYERARILGTRALQIRSVGLDQRFGRV